MTKGCHGDASSGGFGDMDSDVKVVGNLGEPVADVALGAEPKLVAVGEPSSEGFTDEQTGGVVAGADGGGLIEQWSRIEDLKDLGWGRRMACWSESASSPESCPVPGWWMRCSSR
jgi:hypothetical protein